MRPVLDFGPSPLADRFIAPDAGADPNPLYGMNLIFCRDCTLLQLAETPAPELLFDEDYPYFSSVSETLNRQAREFAKRMIGQLGLGSGNSVVEIASNDGYLLRHFRDAGIRVLGVDPAPGPAAAARNAGIETIEAFFGPDMARKLATDGVAADLLVANNVLAHVPDPNGFVTAVARLLAPGALATFEVGYAVDLVRTRAFDTIYHEHRCYFTLHAAKALMERHDMTIVDVEHIPAQGGTLRLHVKHQAATNEVTQSITDMLADEAYAGVPDGHWLDGFSEAVNALVRDLKAMIATLRSSGARIAAYGAAAKGTMLLNACGLTADTIDYVADRNPAKQGRFVTGVCIPVVSPEHITEHPPDYLLILPWNLTAEIASEQAKFLRNDGRFIIPVPSPEIYDLSRLTSGS